MKKNKLVTIAVLSLFLFVASLAGDSLAVTKPQIPNGTIITFGIYDVVKRGLRYEHKESTSGHAEEAVEVVLIEKTTNVPLKKGVTFGIEWEADGLPNIPLKIAMRVKHPPTTKPDGTVSTGFDELLPFVPENGRIEKRGDYYNLTEDWELLPGEWTLSIIYEGKVLCSKVFHIIVP